MRRTLARLAVDPPADAPWNFGRDEAVHAATAADGLVRLRVYGWSTPTVSFGRHERAVGRYDPTRLTALGLTPTRRLTGGRALVHTAELTYSIAAPVDPALSVRRSVERFTAVLANALRHLGEAVEVVPEGAPTVPLSAGACFGAPSVGELTIGGRKLAGSAQWRDAGALLQHGSILLRDDQPLLQRALSADQTAAIIPAAATLSDAHTGRAGAERFAEAFAAAFADEFGTDVERVDSAALVDAADTARLAPRYADPVWVWQR